MSMSQIFLSEFDHEMANTRKTLERIPDDKLNWKPHEKSWSVGELGTHVANLPSWTVYTLEQESLDVAPPGEEPYREEQATSGGELVERFDKNVAAARAAIEGASDEDFSVAWTLLAGGKELFTMPRAAVIRSMILNHLIHHRAQLGVYLRLNDLPVPALYGPSADEGSM
ncbi:MAG: DinB family protein [Deltaproteobacteria bacterium]|nr:DinB family protein [Deltaproteobacteria bacterium]